jgi:hypothetical protein
MACKPPTAAVSMPYCMLAIATAEQMRRHFLFAKRVDVSVREDIVFQGEKVGFFGVVKGTVSI